MVSDFTFQMVGFDTKEEAIEVLKAYTKDPDNFTKVDSLHIKKQGVYTITDIVGN